MADWVWIVDDDMTNLKLAGQILSKHGFRVTARRESFRAPDAHVLVVDDTRMNVTVVEGLLRDTGILLDGVLSGAEAIELCKRIRYD